MALMVMGEVFGFPVDAGLLPTEGCGVCPFQGGPCTKVSASDPLGICGLRHDNTLTVTCPMRFRQDNRIFRDVGDLAFGPGSDVVAVPEIRILQVAGGSRVGKVDYMVGHRDSSGKIADFAALEVQSVYFSGRSLRGAFETYVQQGVVPIGSERRPDFRSSAQKRLMPQLSLKVPVFRRWGQKFFVAVDASFFASLPTFRRLDSKANSEIIWLVYPFSRPGPGERYRMGDPEVVYASWDDVQTALREGTPPEPGEIMVEMQQRMNLNMTVDLSARSASDVRAGG